MEGVDMKRLTDSIHGKGFCRLVGACEMSCETSCKDCEVLFEIFDKLAEYEDLEEQGLLVKLPCKAGDTIYLVDFDECEYDEATIISIEIGKDGIQINSDYEIGTDLNAKYLFLTKEEAEKKLASMQKG